MGLSISNQFYENCEAMNFFNIVDVNSVVRCAVNVQGKSSNSASPSDLLTFNFPIDSNYNGEPIESGFMKMFVSNYINLLRYHKLEITKNNTIDPSAMYKNIGALKYEYYIYLEKIRNLTEKNINPHFIKVLGGSLNATYTNMKNFILSHVAAGLRVLLENNVPIINENQLTVNLADNFIYMIHGKENRTSLTKTSGQSSLTTFGDYFDGAGNPRNMYTNILNFMNEVDYSFILTEKVEIHPAVSTLYDFQNIPEGESITLSTFFNVLQDTQNHGSPADLVYVTEMTYYFFFQIVTACYALFLSGVNHNDLHSGNILIKKLSPRVNVYNIDGNKYNIYTDWSVMLYDFDRAYCSDFHAGYQNKIHIGSDNAALKNKLHVGKDMIKIFYYLWRKADLVMRNDIEHTIAVVGQEGNLRTLFQTQPNQWIEGRVTETQLNTLIAPPLEILQNLYGQFQGVNDASIQANPMLDTYIYICDKDGFYYGNIDMQMQINNYTQELEGGCQLRENLLQQRVMNLEMDNYHLTAERDTLQNELLAINVAGHVV